MITDERVKAEIEALNQELLSQYQAARESKKILEVFKVVKFDPPSDAAHEVVCYRYPIEDLPANCTIVVDMSQVAILDLDGEAIPLLPGTRHVMRDEIANSNIKWLNNWEKNMTGGDPLMHVKVFFLALHKHPNIPFSTAGGPMQAYDAIQGIGVKISAFGVFTAGIENEALDAINAMGFLKTIVGNRSVVTAKEFQEQLSGAIEGEMPSIISAPVNNGQIPSMALPGQISKFSKELEEAVRADFKRNLINLEMLKIKGIKSEKDHEYEELLKAREASVLAGGEASAMRQKGAAAAEVRQMGGYTYQDERGFDVMQAAAGNKATMGTFMGAGMGIGMGIGMGAGMGQAMGNVAQNTMGQMNQPGAAPGGQMMGQQPQQPQQPQPQQAGVQCPNCGGMIPAGSKFCPNCGAQAPAPQAGPKFCPNCGGPLEPGAKFCPNCGNKIG